MVMHAVLNPVVSPVLSPAVTRAGVLDRRALVRRDRVSARLAELDAIRMLLNRAAVRVQVGWVQDVWVARADTQAIDQVCLVSAVRVSGGDPRGQQVNRALDVVWHTLHHDPEGIRWTPPPSVRLARVRDLARWNDHRARRLDDVSGLLSCSAGSAGVEMARLRLSSP
jgi:hypothetical protein